MADNLHLGVLPKRQRLLFEEFSRLDWITGFYLAGGTALALQIAHRRSIDFDFFAEKEFSVLLIKKKLVVLGSYELSAESEQILDGRLNTVRVSFFNLPYPLIRPVLKYGGLRIVAKEDLAAMKLAAISMRGSRKDFIDLYFLLQEYSLAEMIGFYEKKYGHNEENVFCALKGLVYFVDAEKRPMPGMLKSVPWGRIKNHLIEIHRKYIKKIRKGEN